MKLKIMKRKLYDEVIIAEIVISLLSGFIYLIYFYYLSAFLTVLFGAIGLVLYKKYDFFNSQFIHKKYSSRKNVRNPTYREKNKIKLYKYGAIAFFIAGHLTALFIYLCKLIL